MRASLIPYKMDTPVGPWRAPYSNVHAFSSQCFIHELATAAGRDHLDFLLEMFGDPRWLKQGDIRSLNTERAVGVIKRVAQRVSGEAYGFERRTRSGFLLLSCGPCC